MRPRSGGHLPLLTPGVRPYDGLSCGKGRTWRGAFRRAVKRQSKDAARARSLALQTLAPTIGLIDRQTALDHYETLDALGFAAAGLHLDDRPLDAEIVSSFRARYGNHHLSDHMNGN